MTNEAAEHWNGEERRHHDFIHCPHDIEELIEKAAQRGACRALHQLGIDEESREIIKNLIIFMRGVSVGRRALIWLAGFMAAIGTIYFTYKNIRG